MNKWILLAIIYAHLTACMGTLPWVKMDSDTHQISPQDEYSNHIRSPEPTSENIYDEFNPSHSEDDLLTQLRLLNQRLENLEHRAVRLKNTNFNQPVIWACFIELSFDKGKFMAASPHKGVAKFKVLKKCEESSNSIWSKRSDCEQYLRCSSNY